MSKWFQVGIHKSSSTAYMVKRLGGDNLLDVKRLETVGYWTYYNVLIKDPLLILQYSKSCIRLKPL